MKETNMNTTFTASLPPHTDPATITLAAALLASLADPAGSQAKLQQLADAAAAMVQAKADHDTSKAEAEQAAAKLSSLESDRASLVSAKAEHAQAVTQLAVASQANEKRGQLLDQRERSLDAQAADLQRRTAAHDARLKEFRDTLLAG
jgi:hypothetical protein